MKIFNYLLLEFRLLFRSRTTYILTSIFVLAAVWGIISSYQDAIGREEYLSKINEQITKQLVAEEMENNTYIDMTEDIEMTKSMFIPLHPSVTPSYILLIFATIGPMLMGIWGAIIVGNEFSQKTIKVRAAHYHWGKTVLVKMLSVIIIGVLITLIGILTGIIGGNIAWNIVLAKSELINATTFSPTLNGAIFEKIALLIIGLSYYGVMGIFFTLLTRNTLAGALIVTFNPYLEQMISKWWLVQPAYGNTLIKTFDYFNGGVIGKPFVIMNKPLLISWTVLLIWFLLLFIGSWKFSLRQRI